MQSFIFFLVYIFDVFGRPLNQQQSQEISTYAAAKNLEELGGRCLLHSFYWYV